jgi:hypothetical protein
MAEWGIGNRFQHQIAAVGRKISVFAGRGRVAAPATDHPHVVSPFQQGVGEVTQDNAVYDHVRREKLADEQDSETLHLAAPPRVVQEQEFPATVRESAKMAR